MRLLRWIVAFFQEPPFAVPLHKQRREMFVEHERHD
jgi:hypothetical protein